MQRNLVISPTAASSSIEITEIDLGSALFAYNNVFIALLNYMQYKLTPLEPYGYKPNFV